jgi:hypothetical protein
VGETKDPLPLRPRLRPSFGSRLIHMRLGNHGLRGFFRTMLSCSAPFAASSCNHVAEAVNVLEHLVEVFGRALEFSPITFPVKDAHRVFDGKKVVEELRDRLTQLRCFSSSWRRCKHRRNMGTNTVLFKAKPPAMRGDFGRP